MNGHDKDAIKMGDLVDQCGNSVASGDVFVLYDERYRNYLGLGDKDWLTLTQSSPAGFFWQTSPSNPSSIQYLKMNGAIANYDSYGYVNLVGANCEDKTFKWVVKKIKKSSGWSGTYSVNDIVNC
ncbi:hypothetical protein BGW38_006791 [Lunasporangiospora selenospora]|uniref:Uncharacterized protein n=1 Tax=Lunasporangiospora selenospora TaxID=979761 RepID=A0A9P6FNA5_9FUNG|nr:hypothetical protein BGW38_006791 [Lunasporangiospora selenospora]